MIPKIIHYCWFGKKPLPKLAKKCLRSWKKHCPDFSFLLWNEENFDVNVNLFVKQSYEVGNYAFVSDFVRLYVVYQYGGIYLDTDVQLIKSVNSLLDYDAFFGFEGVYPNGEYYVATGLGFGSICRHPLLKMLINDYEKRNVVSKDGVLVETRACPIINRDIFMKYGFVMNGKTQIIDNTILLDQSYLCPIMFNNTVKLIKKNTISIHYYAATWVEQSENKKRVIRNRNNKIKHYIEKIFGRFVLTVIVKIVRSFKRLKK